MARLESAWAKGAMHPTSTGPLLVDEAAPRYRDARAADFTEARNKLLFNFGILLLEIGYGRPWHELRQSVAKTPTAAGEKLSDYRAAEKLAGIGVESRDEKGHPEISHGPLCYDRASLTRAACS